jgi:hypothetical protein
VFEVELILVFGLQVKVYKNLHTLLFFVTFFASLMDFVYVDLYIGIAPE